MMYHKGNEKKKRDTTIHPLEWPRSRTLTTTNASEDVEEQNSHSLLVGMQSGTATLEDNLAISSKSIAYSYHMIQQSCSLVFI